MQGSTQYASLSCLVAKDRTGGFPGLATGDISPAFAVRVDKAYIFTYQDGEEDQI